MMARARHAGYLFWALLEKSEVLWLERRVGFEEKAAIMRLAVAEAGEDDGVGVVLVDGEFVAGLLPCFYEEFYVYLAQPRKVECKKHQVSKDRVAESPALVGLD